MTVKVWREPVLWASQINPVLSVHPYFWSSKVRNGTPIFGVQKVQMVHLFLEFKGTKCFSSRRTGRILLIWLAQTLSFSSIARPLPPHASEIRNDYVRTKTSTKTGIKAFLVICKVFVGIYSIPAFRWSHFLNACTNSSTFHLASRARDPRCSRSAYIAS